MSSLYLQFLDHIFLIWTRILDELMKVKQKINKVHPSMKFNLYFSYRKINFLDTVVFKIDSGKLEIKLYRKESDQYAYLHRKFENPESLRQSTWFAQAFDASVQ